MTCKLAICIVPVRLLHAFLGIAVLSFDEKRGATKRANMAVKVVIARIRWSS
jgi:hypothetical protein